MELSGLTSPQRSLAKRVEGLQRQPRELASPWTKARVKGDTLAAKKNNQRTSKIQKLYSIKISPKTPRH